MSDHPLRDIWSAFPVQLPSILDIFKGRLDMDMESGSMEVAIKVCRYYLRDKDLDESICPPTLQQFRREIAVRLELDHPNILPLIGTIRDPGLRTRFLLVSPWIEKGASTPYLKVNDQLTVSERLGLVGDITRGLQYQYQLDSTSPGALRYLAPEVVVDGGTIMQTDVYSFGSITLQILTGRIPYHYVASDI
ncbi:kinase-like domain-containing protein [Chiua virens]|nr:kinase-like domain-containing protein [Chiua virens]